MPQLDPMIPFDTPKGKGFAFWRSERSHGGDTLYSIIIADTGEVWDILQRQLRTTEPGARRGNCGDGRAMRKWVTRDGNELWATLETDVRLLHAKSWMPAESANHKIPEAGASERPQAWTVWKDAKGLLAEFPPSFNPNSDTVDCNGGPWKIA